MSGHYYRGISAYVACRLLSTVLDDKRPETAKINLLTVYHGRPYVIHEPFDNLQHNLLLQACLHCYFPDDIRFCHINY